MNKDFLSVCDLTRDELEELFALADELRLSSEFKPLKGISAALIFEKPSLRTRASFELGIKQLGGMTTLLSDDGIGIDVRESAADIARFLNRCTQLIVARVFRHGVLTDLARNSDVPVVNALSDLSHPCQIISDLYTIRQHGRLREGMKIVFVGDGNNVVNSWLELAAIYPLHFVLAAPKGYDPSETILRQAWNAGVSRVEIVRDPVAAVAGADVVYTDVWTSMGQEDSAALRKTAFEGYRVDMALMNNAPESLFMHCLPAHRGEEVTHEVLESDRYIIFDQAENRLHMQKALLTGLVERWRTAERPHQSLQTVLRI